MMMMMTKMTKTMTEQKGFFADFLDDTDLLRSYSRGISGVFRSR